VWFDQDINLFAESTGWLKGDDGFLVIDENGSGTIEDASEMFGGRGRTGTAELRTHDLNNDGKINAADAVWGSLRVWQDKDEDAVTDAGELLTLEELGIVEFNLTVSPINFLTPQRNSLLDKGSYTFASGGTGEAANDNLMLSRWVA
jgi:hypothetical protein